MYSDVVDEVPPDEAGSGMARVFEDDDDRNFGDVRLLKGADVRASHRIDWQ